MADFNKIHVTGDGGIQVNNEELALLLFNDGKVLSKSKYSLENHLLSILEDTTRTITLFYNNYIATVYEFTIVLKENNTKLPPIDNKLKQVTNLYKDRLLVFIDGILEPVDGYDVLDNNTLIIKNKQNDILQHNVIVYSSALNFERNITIREPNSTLNLDNVSCPNYSQYKTMVFLDGIKIDYNEIESFIDPQSGLKKEIKINNADNKANVLEIIRFYDENDRITSLNFETDQGYLTYGPYDDFGNRIPNMYDITFEFQDQLKLVVDDIKTGFFIKEENGSGEAIVIDETFEGTTLHGIVLQPFTTNYYTNSEYYFKVPEYTSIINYLSEFDTKYTFIPEILNLFQRLLLDEIQDTIQRLRNSRSIQKVDSTQVNKLLQLLGCNLNTKRLNKKQRRELIEELNNFYNIAGTRNSYNILNILQNDLKLIDMEQLFTPFDVVSQSKKKKAYNYLTTTVTYGTGYKIGDYLITHDPSGGTADGVLGRVVEINDRGGITRNGFELAQTSGYTTIHGNNLELQPAINDTIINVRSIPSEYQYNYSLNSDTHGYHASQTLYTEDNKFHITIDSVDNNGKILTSTLYPTSGSNYETLTAVNLILESYSITAKISSISQETREVCYYKHYYDLNNGAFDITLPPGVYEIEISGAGGSGGSGDSNFGVEGDLLGEDGYAGEKIVRSFSLTSNTNVYGTLGQGGGAVKTTNKQVIWEDTFPPKGKGYTSGKNGDGRTGDLYERYVKKHYVIIKEYKTRHMGWWCVKGGQGGGSSQIRINNTELIAKGGNGGNAGNCNTPGGYSLNSDYYNNETRIPKMLGGTGGSGGTTSGTGSAGGKGCTKTGTFHSEDGQDGYVKITKVLQKYVADISGDLERIHAGDIYQIQTTYDTFTGTIYIDDTGNKKMRLVSQTTGTDKGYLYITTTAKLNTNVDNAKLTLTSTPKTYHYSSKLKNLSIDYLKVGDKFKTDASEQPQFIAEIVSIDRTNNSYTATYSPTSGNILVGNPNDPEGIDKPASYQTGSGAFVNIQYTETDASSTSDLCYVDFRTKEELGAKKHKEFRSEKIDYGIITEGTPKSPRWWKVGDPDIDYGSINEDTDKDQSKDYGYIKDKVKGEWVEWWEWNRSSEWYPTNHVITEIKMPTDVDFKEFSETYVEQFYKLASAVVYIHAITESFYFGTNVTTNTSDAKSSALFGVAVGAPIMTYEDTVTSNPSIQYLQPTPINCTLTIIPTPADATVKLECPGYNTISGTGIQSMTVAYGKSIKWTVQKQNYITRVVNRHMVEDATKRVVLEKRKFQLNVHTNPLDAKVIIDGVERDNKCITVPHGTTVAYKVLKEGYVTSQLYTKTVTRNETVNVPTLTPVS